MFVLHCEFRAKVMPNDYAFNDVKLCPKPVKMVRKFSVGARNGRHTVPGEKLCPLWGNSYDEVNLKSAECHGPVKEQSID